MLHHTTIAHSMDTAIVPRLICIGRDRVSPRGVRSAEREVSPLERWLSLGLGEVMAALAACCRARYIAWPGELDPEELAEALALAEAKYATDAWILRVR